MQLSMEILQEFKTIDSIARKNEIVDEIENRTIEIIKSIGKVFNRKIYGWSWQYGDIEASFSFNDNVNNIDIVYSLEWDGYDLNYIDEDGDYWDLAVSFPINWLWDDFEKKLIEGVERFKEKDKKAKIEHKARREQLKNLKSEYRKSAMKKLTPEELWATELSKKMPKSLKHFAE